MKLVEFLVSGVAGAEDGTATFVLRGTATSAASVLYSDFEGTTQPGTNIITLDSNGAAEIYCNAYCDVTLKNEAGATIRTVTVGNAATTVEVISDSFTGTDYSGAPTAVSEPITLAAILDKWNNSSGATNWQVSIGGVATNISSAFASLTGIYTNVKDPTYGAVGDGVADDTTAISNAIAAANGSIVFFPPGTYKISTITITDSNYNLLGSGPGSSIITGYQANTNLILLDNNLEGFGTICQLGFAATAAYTNCIAISPTQNVQFTNCHFDTTNYVSGMTNLAFDGGSFALVSGCLFTVDTASDFAVSNLSNDSQCFFAMNNCRFEVESGFDGTVISGPDFNVTNCTVDASSVTSGIYYHVDPESNATAGKMLGTFVGNRFIDGSSSGFAFKLTSVQSESDFSESDNMFTGFDDPAITAVGNIYDLSVNASQVDAKFNLGSRKGKVLRFTNSAGATVTIKAAMIAETIVITHSFAGNLTITISSDVHLMNGAEVFIYVINTSGNSRTITFDTGFAQTPVIDNGVAWALYRFVQKAAGTTRATVVSSALNTG